MDSLLATCSKALKVDRDWCCCLEGECEEEDAVRKSTAPPAAGLGLALRVGYAPGVESAGARLGPFGLGDDIAVTDIKQLSALEPLQWRQQLASGRGSSSSSSRSNWPHEDIHFRIEQNCWRAKVVVSDGASGFEEHWCVLQVAALPKDRTMGNAQVAVDDGVVAASYAHRFNANTAQLHAEEEGGSFDAETVVGVRVCVPVACYVLGGTAQEVASPGQAITVTKYPYTQVKKFVFDGQQDFLELPHAFFHFTSWMSGGREVVADIQGLEDEDGDIIILDPVILRPAKEQASVGSLLSTLTTSQEDGETLEKRRFDLMHPRCGQLCKSFDPFRRSTHVRRQCGLSMPTCGVGGA